MPSFIRKKILQEIRKEQQEQARANTFAITDLIYEKEADSLDVAMEQSIMQAKRTSIEKMSF